MSLAALFIKEQKSFKAHLAKTKAEDLICIKMISIQALATIINLQDQDNIQATFNWNIRTLAEIIKLWVWELNMVRWKI